MIALYLVGNMALDPLLVLIDMKKLVLSYMQCVGVVNGVNLSLF